MQYENFIKRYKPIPNEVVTGACFNGRMFETFGAEHEAVKQAFRNNPKSVWTYVDCDGGGEIIAGYHWVNRLGYFITTKPYINEMQFVSLD